MALPIHHPGEDSSNSNRDLAVDYEPQALRTFTPTQAVLARSSGIYHWTPEGRRLYDFTSGVLVANLGHNPSAWMQRFTDYMGWPSTTDQAPRTADYFPALPMTAYNAVTPIETDAVRRLVALLQGRPGGQRLEQVLWAASGSE